MKHTTVIDTHCNQSTEYTVSDVHFLRQTAPYIHTHKGKKIVIMINSASIEHENFSHLMSDIALLNTLGDHLILVYSARDQITQKVKEQKKVCTFYKDTLITDKSTLECVKDVVGNIRMKIEALLSLGVIHSPIPKVNNPVVSGHFITAKPLGIYDGVDYQYTGAIKKINKHVIHNLLFNGYITLIAPLGLSSSGEIFYIDAETLAT